jgi:proteasome activator subunit 4
LKNDHNISFLFKSNKNRDPELENLQKVDIFLQQLPYFDKIKTNGFATYEEIKRNILLTITLNEIRPGLIHWSNRLIVFIHEFGLFFSKDEHVQLIKLYLKLIYTSDLDLPTVEVGLNVLYELLKYII